jgi:serine/threonine-protein kinase
MPHPGQLLDGKYRLDALLAGGGEGAVWRATHELIGRTYAVKFREAGRGDAALLVERFAREARAAAQVQHRFVVTIFDYGATDAGELYVVTELLEGQSLAERLEGAPPLPLRELVRLVLHCLSGLAALHGAGIVHRDFKPENVFLVRDADGWCPKLLDFGLSRADGPADGAPLRARALTAARLGVGTPWYGAPEQVRGRHDVDPRADLYGVGVLLFRAAAGRFPFEAAEIPAPRLRAGSEEAPPLVALRPEAGRALSDVVARALARAPEARYASARALQAALEAVVDQIPADLPAAWAGAFDGGGVSGVVPGGAGERACSPGDAAPARSTGKSAAARTPRRFVPAALVALAGGFALATFALRSPRRPGAAAAPAPLAPSAVRIEPLPARGPLGAAAPGEPDRPPPARPSKRKRAGAPRPR